MASPLSEGQQTATVGLSAHASPVASSGISGALWSAPNQTPAISSAAPVTNDMAITSPRRSTARTLLERGINRNTYELAEAVHCERTYSDGESSPTEPIGTAMGVRCR